MAMILFRQEAKEDPSELDLQFAVRNLMRFAKLISMAIAGCPSAAERFTYRPSASK
jgi:hypothetical protein